MYSKKQSQIRKIEKAHSNSVFYANSHQILSAQNFTSLFTRKGLDEKENIRVFLVTICC
jgi:hypothetical protein